MTLCFCVPICASDNTMCAELNCRDDEWNTPLHCAVQRNQKESLLCLLEKGADPNLLNRGLMSPLHLAVNQSYNTLVHVSQLELLVQHILYVFHSF